MSHYDSDEFDDPRGWTAREIENTRKDVEQRARKLNRKKSLHKELAEKYPEVIEYLDLCDELK